MSLQVSSLLVVGLPFEEVCDTIEEHEILSDNPKYLQSLELEVFSPYYDAELSNCLIGIRLVSSGNYDFKEISEHIEVEKLKQVFEKVTNKKAKLYITTNIY